ncbi:MAG: bifunctional UDP-N-acetylmuramoyl-tripeptide:D-alanyl-D-alanine ligase/alanine racemase [Prevotella sp.]|nr:bifunctional UDP-N-acetylmuramoyl-tripeptide:D-alanyl-D-alanine ligase/alanine racemase [Prevotella sp.]
MTYSIEKVTTLIGARRYGEAEATIGWLLTDSRSLRFPEQTLFFALHTQRNDGHKYIAELYRRGVRSFVVEQVPEGYDTLFPNANFLKVPSTLAALQRLAERHRDEFLASSKRGTEVPIVGITGSNGKTIVKEWLYQLLSATKQQKGGMITRSPKSYNSQIGVPLSVWLLNEHTTVGIFEAGISQLGEMQALHDIIQPTVGVFTSLGMAHQENFRSMEEKCMEKLLLFGDTEAIVYPSDNDIVSRCIRRMDFKGERIGWSHMNERAEMYVKSVKENQQAEAEDRSKSHTTTITYIYKGEQGCYTIPFIDEASIEDSIACVATALHLGVTKEEVAKRMPLLEPVAMRLEVKQGQRGLTLINDSYNSDINSLDIALDFMNRRGEEKKTLILSDIYQSGETPTSLYRQVSDHCIQRGVDTFIGIGEVISQQQELIKVEKKYFFPNVEQFTQSEVFRNMHDEMILLKGSRNFGFEHITELLEQKVHETILEVNLQAVVDNLNHFRKFLKPETKMVCMIKADGYGAGAIEIAKTLQNNRVDYLAVAVADEGVALRKAGITANIMVMNPEMTSFKTLFDYDLEPEVYSFRLMDALIKVARQEGITGWPVHIKLDTGMHRLGFNVESGEIDELIERLKHQTAIIPRSVFSHFVGSDSDDFDTFSTQQFELFQKGSQQLQAAFSHHILRHMDNSAGIEHFPERQMDMCRLGIGLYGVEPYLSEKPKGRAATDPLKTVSTLKTTILQMRKVKAGDSIGYSRRTVLDRDSMIAAIPIGYADGLNRRLGNRTGYCLVNGQKAPYVGNICMDVAMIDVTGIDCQEGDTAIIFGEDLPVTVLSDLLGTISYEVLTGVSNRVKRIYFQD